MKRHIILFIAGFLIFSCSKSEKAEQPIAKVFNTYFYASDLKKVFPDGIKQKDSLVVMKSIVDKWIRKQLLLHKAEQNLTDEQKNVSRQLEDYRASLLIYQYKQQLFHQKLDTILTDKEVEEYYMKNQSNFILDKNIVKGLFLKIPKSAPNVERVRSWYASTNAEDIIHLEDYCYQFAAKYDYFDDQWVLFDDLLKQLPFSENNQERFLRYTKKIELRDSVYHFFVSIKEYKLKSEIAPIDFVKKDIKSIIMNKRRIEFENDMEKDIYNEAVNHNEFKIFN